MYTYVEMTSTEWSLHTIMHLLRHCEEAQLCRFYFTVYKDTQFPVVPMFLSPASDHRAEGERRKEAAFTTAVSATNCSC